MTRNVTTLAAALALFAATALPALAQSTPSVAPVSPAPSVSTSASTSTSTQKDMHTGTTLGAKSDAQKVSKDPIAKDAAKDAKEVKHPQIAQQPGVAPKLDGAMKSDTTIKSDTSK